MERVVYILYYIDLSVETSIYKPPPHHASRKHPRYLCIKSIYLSADCD